MAKDEEKNILKSLFKIIENVVQEIKVDHQTTFSWRVDYDVIENAEVNKASITNIVDQLINHLQKFQAQHKDETAIDASELPMKKIKIDQDSYSESSPFHKGQPKGIPIDDIDWTLVQVTANKSEIDRRISAFMQQKQTEVDLINRREFCNIVDTNQENVTRVGNTSTSDEAQALSHVTENKKSCKPKVTCREPAVMERLQNIEQHLGFNPGKPVPIDIYEHLQDLESRILHLESLSPEYFNKNNVYISSTSQTRDSLSIENMSLSDIDERISSLKNLLLTRYR